MIYLDHAATTRLHPAARDAMLPFLNGAFGNPSGLYELGRAAQAAVDGARTRVAATIGARSSEVLFTSGGTESINTALLGIAYALRRAGSGNHVISTAIEHHAGLHATQFLEELGFDVTYVGCDASGHLDLGEFERSLRPETVLASVMLANNEVGTVQPIGEISAMLADYRRAHGQHRILLHTDAVQAPGWLSLDVDELGVDALSLSSHKFGGPKGAGILFLRRASPFRQLIHGGGQESQKRAGTENVAGIAGTATALEISQSDVTSRSARVARLRERLRDSILAAVPAATVNGCQQRCLPNNLNISFDGIESDLLVAALDAAGVAASSGSACSNSMWEPSHVLMAMGVPIRRAVGSVRFSLGAASTEAEIDSVARILPPLVSRLRGA
ncbi:MAG: cysteine desulfurase family protein [Dehalococcoidia bacterium]